MIRRANDLERDFQAQVTKLARLAGWKVYHTHDSRRSAPGFPDLCMVKPPHVVFVELKRDGGKLSEAQEDWLAMLGKCDHVHSFVWRPEMWNAIERVLTGR